MGLGQSLGSAYVEVGLKKDKLESGLNNLKKETQTTVHSIESTFNNAKLKFDTEFPKMKLKDLKGEAEKLRAEFERKKINPNISVASLELTKQKLQKVEGALQTVGMEAEDVGKKVNWLGRTMQSMFARIGALIIVKKIFDFGRSIINAASDFEALRTRLTSLYGSAEKANDVFNQFKQIAATTPYSLKGVVEAGATIKAFGMNAEKTLKSVTDLAAYMGVDVVEAASAVGRAFAGGVGAADVLRERGVLNLIKSFKGIDDLTKLSLPEFRKALIEAMQDPAAGIAGSTTRLSKTFSGAMSNMGDAIENFSAAIGSYALPFLNSLVKGVTSLTTALTPGKTALEETKQKAKDQATQFDILTSRYISLREKTNKTATEQTLYTNTINELQKLYPNYLENVDLHKDGLDKIKTAFVGAREELDKYLNNLVKLAVVEGAKEKYTELGQSLLGVTKDYEDASNAQKEFQKTGKVQRTSIDSMAKFGLELPPVKMPKESSGDFAKRVNEYYGKVLGELGLTKRELDTQLSGIADTIEKTTKEITKSLNPTNDKGGGKDKTVIDVKAVESSTKSLYDYLKYESDNYKKQFEINLAGEITEFKKTNQNKTDILKYENQKRKEFEADYYEFIKKKREEYAAMESNLARTYPMGGGRGKRTGGIFDNAPSPADFRNKLNPTGTGDVPKIQTPEEFEKERREVEKLNRELSVTGTLANAVEDGFSQAGNQLARTIGQSVQIFGQANSLLQQFINNLAQAVVQMLALAAAQAAVNFITGGLGSLFGGGASAAQAKSSAAFPTGGDIGIGNLAVNSSNGALLSGISQLNSSVQAMNLNAIKAGNKPIQIVVQTADPTLAVKHFKGVENNIVKGGVNTSELRP